MKLSPKDPPGRSTRRARGFATDIGLLRLQGYTFEAIRRALAEAGVKVRKSTAQREMTRLASSLSSGSVAVPEPTLRAPQAAPAPSLAPLSEATDLRSGKEIAEAFASTRITNPWVRARLNAKEPS